MSEPIQLPDGRICDCGVGNFDPVAHALNCPAKTTPEDLAEFFPPNESLTEAQGHQFERVADSIANQADKALDEQSRSDYSSGGSGIIDVPFPEGLVEEKKRKMQKADRYHASELTGLNYEGVELPILPSSDGSPEQEAALKEAIEERNRMLKHGIRTGDTSKGLDTRNVHGVGMIGGEQIIITKIDQKQIWSLGYDVEQEGRDLAKSVGMVAEKDNEDGSTTYEVPEKTLEEEGVVTRHEIRKWLPRA